MKGIHPNGKATFTAGAAIAKGEFVKFSSGKVVKCAVATDIAIGVALGRFDTFGALDLLGKGTLGMSETLIVAILAGGLFKTIQANGGILWLTEKIAKLVRGPRSCEFGMGVLVALVNCFTANNTVAIVIAGPIAKACSNRFKVDPIRMASVLDTVSCIVQGVIPYGAQLLIAAELAQLSPIEIIRHLYYPMALALLAVGSIFLRYPRRYS